MFLLVLLVLLLFCCCVIVVGRGGGAVGIVDVKNVICIPTILVYLGVKEAPPLTWAASAGPEYHNSEVKLYVTGIK